MSLTPRNTQAIIDRFQEEQGWTDTTVLDLLVDYLDNQGSDDALEAYLQEVADNENEGGENA